MLYQNWTKQQITEATGRWVSTEHKGPPPDTDPVLVFTGKPDDEDQSHAIGYYSPNRDAWVVQVWAGEPKIYAGYKSVGYWQCLTLPGSEPATRRRSTGPGIDQIIAVRDTAKNIIGDLLEWEAEQGGYVADVWDKAREIRNCSQKFSVIEIYDALKALDDWGHFIGGWEAEVWTELEDFVVDFAEHIHRLRVSMGRCSPRT